MEETILTEQEIRDLIHKLALQIQRSGKLDHFVMVGIRTGGAFLAQRLKVKLMELASVDVPTGVIDITLYRDDWTRISSTPIVGTTELPFSLNDADVLLVDDVIFTGRTIRAAMDALIDFGRPKRIRVAALVDRGGRELPILANFVGIHRDTLPGEMINVYLKEKEGVDRAVVEKKCVRSNLREKPRLAS